MYRWRGLAQMELGLLQPAFVDLRAAFAQRQQSVWGVENVVGWTHNVIHTCGPAEPLEMHGVSQAWAAPAALCTT